MSEENIKTENKTLIIKKDIKELAKNRMVAIGISQNPNSIQSYGILIKHMVESTVDKYFWNLMIEGNIHNKPEVYPHYIKWSTGKNTQERDSVYIPKMIERIKPEFLFTIGDIQNFRMTRYYVSRNVPWIHWLPIDHEDGSHLIKTAYTIYLMDLCIPMSKFGQEFALRNGVMVSDYIYPFIDTKLYSPIKPHEVTDTTKKSLVDSLKEFRQQCAPNGEKILLWVGRPGWRKNLEMLIGAFKELIVRGRKDVVLYLHTDTNDPAKIFDMGKLIHSFKLPSKKIQFTSDMEWYSGAPDWFLRGLYNMADLYVSTHGGEGFGMPIAEAMSCKTPFVITDCTTTEEFGKDEEGNWSRGLGVKIHSSREDNGVLRPYVDIDDFADKVEWMLDNPVERVKMGLAGREWVIKNCSIPVIRDKWIEVFDKMEMKQVQIGGVIEDA